MKRFFNLQRFDNIDIGTGILHSLVSGTSSNDSIRNQGNMITIQAGAGNDTIYNYNAQLAKTYLGDGDDSIENYSSNNGVISGDSGNDTIYSRYSEKVTISGGDGDDSIYSYNSNNSDGNNSISGGAGKDTIMLYNYASSNNIETIYGGKGDDLVSLGSSYNRNFIQYNQGDGYDVIYGFDSYDTLHVTGTSISTMTSGSDAYVFVGNETIVLKNAASSFSSSNFVTVNGSGSVSESTITTIQANSQNTSIGSGIIHALVSGRTDADSINNQGNMITIKAGAGNDTVYNYNAQLTRTYLGDGGDSIENYSSNNGVIYGESGNDTIYNRYSEKVTISGGDGDDSIYSYNSNNSDGNNSISGGAGNDTIMLYNYASSSNIETIYGGKGDDLVSLGSSYNRNFIQYNQGDGYDVIYGFDSYDTLHVTGTSISTMTSGSDAYVFVGDGTIVLKNAANNFSSSNFVTVNGSGSDDGGDDDGGDDDSGNDETNAWTISGTTAKYGTSSKTLVTVKGVKSVDGLSLSGKVVTVADSSLNNKKVTISNGYTLKLADDVSKSSTTKAAWSYDNSIATYKSASKTAGYSLASNGKSISYTSATSAKTLAKITGAKSKKGLSLSGKKITLKNSALTKKVTVSGSYEFNFAAGYKNATISGTAKADTITARGSKLKIVGGKGKDSLKMVGTNLTLSGGKGADTFIYAASGGKERITDFQSNDTLKIGVNGDGTYSTVTSGDDVIVSTDDGGKITLVGAAEKSLNISGTKKNSGANVKVSGKKITLTSSYDDNSFSLSGTYSSAVTLDASQVLLDLNIKGNAFANSIVGSSQSDTIDGGAGADTIYGGAGKDSIFGGTGDDELHGGKGNDTLWGGAGDDELYGDAGKDTFYYRTGEGNDTIYGYEASVDQIVLGKGSISNVTFNNDKDVIFTIGDGQLVVNNAVGRTVKIVDTSGKIVANGLYEP